MKNRKLLLVIGGIGGIIVFVCMGFCILGAIGSFLSSTGTTSNSRVKQTTVIARTTKTPLPLPTVISTVGATATSIQVEVTPVETSTSEITSDDITNEKIQSLTCDESTFKKRQAERSSFVDLEQTSLEGKTVFFKEGFVDTEYFAHKKLLEETARIFRDFPCIGQVKVVIELEGQKYFSDIEIKNFEQFLGVDFILLQENIEKWRTFLGSINKSLVQEFAKQYVRKG